MEAHKRGLQEEAVDTLAVLDTAALDTAVQVEADTEQLAVVEEVALGTVGQFVLAGQFLAGSPA